MPDFPGKWIQYLWFIVLYGIEQRAAFGSYFVPQDTGVPDVSVVTFTDDIRNQWNLVFRIHSRAVDIVRDCYVLCQAEKILPLCIDKREDMRNEINDRVGHSRFGILL